MAGNPGGKGTGNPIHDPKTGQFGFGHKAKKPKGKQGKAKAAPLPFDEKVAALGQAQSRWLGGNKLTRGEAEELVNYVYTTDYHNINTGLRNNNVAPEYRSSVKILDRAMTKSRTTEDMVVYRALSGTATQRIKQLTYGQTMTDPAFMSTTTSRAQAYGFESLGEETEDINAVMAIKVRKGTGALVPSAVRPEGEAAGEQEVLLDRGLTLQFTGVDRNGDYGFQVLSPARFIEAAPTRVRASTAMENMLAKMTPKQRAAFEQQMADATKRKEKESAAAAKDKVLASGTPELPLLVLSCSSVKNKAATGPMPLTELYQGPIWQQAKNNYPADHIAVLSAEHGFQPPDAKIAPYDREMDDQRLIELLSDPKQVESFVNEVNKHGKAVIIGGETYKLFALGIVATHPELINKVHFGVGSYLQQRHALKQLFDFKKEVESASQQQGVSAVQLAKGRQPRKPTEIQAMDQSAKQVARSLNYDGDISVVGGAPKVYNIGDKTYLANAEAEIGGGIKIYANGFGVDDKMLPGIVAHEIMHQKFNRFLVDYMADKTKFEGAATSSALTAAKRDNLMNIMTLDEAGGVSNYSKDWWQAAHEGKCAPSTAVHETLADIAQGTQLTKGTKQKIVVPEVWQKLYDAVNAHWDAVTPRTTGAAKRKQPDQGDKAYRKNLRGAA